MLLSGVISDASVVLLPTDGLGIRSSESKFFHLYYDSKLLISTATRKGCPTFCIPKIGYGGEKYHRSRGLVPKAAGNSSEDMMPVVPLQFESPVGQFLVQILHTHRHLLSAAIDQQLQNLSDIDTHSKKSPPPSSPDFLLYKRIAEVREKEKGRALEEIIYCLIIQKFIDNGISMIPNIPTTSSDSSIRVDFWPNQDQKLKSIHSPEAFEMVQSHLFLLLGDYKFVGPLDSLIELSKIKLGKLYAASIMYGYFLKRVDQRFQLERSMKTLPNEGKREITPPSRQLWDDNSLIRVWIDDDNDVSEGGKSERLRSYVLYLDSETLQRYATVRSKEGICLIERQAQALFGRPDIKIDDDGSLEASNDKPIRITFSGLNLLVLEAVAFGSFLWEAESYVLSVKT